jgi:hypothetical protein
MHYRGQHDQGCPYCLGTGIAPVEDVGYRGPMGTREEQKELIQKVCEMYQEEYPKLGGTATSHIAQTLGMKRGRVQNIIRRSRNRGLL